MDKISNKSCIPSRSHHINFLVCQETSQHVRNCSPNGNLKEFVTLIQIQILACLLVFTQYTNNHDYANISGECDGYLGGE
jgi:hypothetical protein